MYYTQHANVDEKGGSLEDQRMFFFNKKLCVEL